MAVCTVCVKKKSRKLFQIEILELKANQLRDSTWHINTPKVNDIYNWNYMHCEKNFFSFLFLSGIWCIYHYYFSKCSLQR